MEVFEIVGAVGEDAAVELRQIGRELIELGLHAEVLVVGEQVLDAGVERKTAAGSGVDLRALARLLLRLLARAGCWPAALREAGWACWPVPAQRDSATQRRSARRLTPFAGRRSGRAETPPPLYMINSTLSDLRAMGGAMLQISFATGCSRIGELRSGQLLLHGLYGARR